MNAFQNRFQEYAPDYMNGKKETDLIKLDGIDKVQISMLVPEFDMECSLERARETAKTIGTPVVNFTVIGGKDSDHSYFGNENGEWFMNLLISQLMPA